MIHKGSCPMDVFMSTPRSTHLMQEFTIAKNKMTSSSLLDDALVAHYYNKISIFIYFCWDLHHMMQ